MPNDVEIILSTIRDLKSDVKGEVGRMTDQVTELSKVVNSLVTKDAVQAEQIQKLDVEVKSHAKLLRGWRDGALGTAGVGGAIAAIWKFFMVTGGGTPPGH